MLPRHKGLDEVRSRCRRGQIAVPEQKQQPQQLFQEQEQQEVAGEKGEVGKEGAGGGRPGRGHMESRSICNGRRINSSIGQTHCAGERPVLLCR